MALLLQSGSTAAMPLVASLAEQESRRLSFLPMALIFVPVHLSALAVPAPRVMMARTPSAAAATDAFIFVPFIESSGSIGKASYCGLDVIVKEKSGPLGFRARRPGADRVNHAECVGKFTNMHVPGLGGYCKLASSGAGGRANLGRRSIAHSLFSLDTKVVRVLSEPPLGRRRATVVVTWLAGKNGDPMKVNERLTTSLLAFALMWSALLLVKPPAASAVPGKLTDDAYTIGGSSTNTGIQGVLHVIDAGASTQKTFIQFDLSSMSALPSPLTSADVDKASLTLFVDAVGAAGSIDLREVTSAWNESTVNGMPEPTTVASTVPSFMVTTSRKFVVIDVTELVKAWLHTSLSN